MSKYWVFSGPYFPAFGLNTEIYGIINTGKYGPEKAHYFWTLFSIIYLGLCLWNKFCSRRQSTSNEVFPLFRSILGLWHRSFPVNCKISKNIFFTKRLRTTALTILWKIWIYIKFYRETKFIGKVFIRCPDLITEVHPEAHHFVSVKNIKNDKVWRIYMLAEGFPHRFSQKKVLKTAAKSLENTHAEVWFQ